MNRNISKTDIIIGLIGLGVLILMSYDRLIPQRSSERDILPEKESTSIMKHPESIDNKILTKKDNSEEKEKYTYFVDSSSDQIIDGTQIGEWKPTIERKILENLQIWLTEKKDAYELRVFNKDENANVLECKLNYKETINGLRVYRGLYTRMGQVWEIEIYPFDPELQISDIVRGKNGKWEISWIINGNREILYAIIILPS